MFLHERSCPDELAARSDDYFPNRSVLITAPSESGLDGIGAQRPAPSIATEKIAERMSIRPWLAPLDSKSHCFEYVGMLARLAQEDRDLSTGYSVQSS